MSTKRLEHLKEGEKIYLEVTRKHNHEMTKQEMLDAIYAEMGIYQGPDSAPAVEFEPVRIGNVLKYIDTNCCLKEPSNDGLRERDMLELDKMLRSVFYAFVGKQDRPIEEQDEQCIEFVYNLIKK